MGSTKFYLINFLNEEGGSKNEGGYHDIHRFRKAGTEYLRVLSILSRKVITKI
jgi:hypothetical protein